MNLTEHEECKEDKKGRQSSSEQVSQSQNSTSNFHFKTKIFHFSIREKGGIALTQSPTSHLPLNATSYQDHFQTAINSTNISTTSTTTINIFPYPNQAPQQLPSSVPSSSSPLPPKPWSLPPPPLRCTVVLCFSQTESITAL